MHLWVIVFILLCPFIGAAIGALFNIMGTLHRIEKILTNYQERTRCR